jgi:hypothetical protein
MKLLFVFDRVKIYILVAVLIVGMILYAVVEVLHRQMSKDNQK